MKNKIFQAIAAIIFIVTFIGAATGAYLYYQNHFTVHAQAESKQSAVRQSGNPLVNACMKIYQYYLDYYFTVDYQPESYTTTNKELNNPYQGWYRIYGYALSDSEPVNMETVQTAIASDDNQLVLLEINLRDYASSDISATGLSQLENVLLAWKDSGKQLILRFLYDWNGKAKETEPQNISIIKRHMAQTAKIVNQHADCIYLMQGIYVGNCGEMNNSNYMSEENMCELAEYLDSVIDKSIYLSVRTPAHYRAIGKSFEPLAEKDAFSDSIRARLGLFNDGMLGSASDLGTYGETSIADAKKFTDKGTREEEIDFQNTLCHYVPNGGEVVMDNEYNDFSNAITDLKDMHISYLDCGYDLAVLDKWRTSTYDGNDCFQGTDGYSYIGAHLGCRYAIYASDCSFDTAHDDTATLSVTIENSGFSSSYRKFASTITVLREDGSVCDTIPVDTDNRFWKSGENATFHAPLDIRTYKDGTYHIYYQLSDSALDCNIRLANDSTPSDYGYLVSSFTVGK